MAASPHNTRATIINRSSPTKQLSAYNTRSAIMNQQGVSNHLSAYSTLSAITNEHGASDKPGAPGKPCAHSTRSTTTNAPTASGKLSAYEISSVTRKKYRDVLQVGQQSITREDECLDEDCGSFCQGSKDQSSKTELEGSQDDFSLNMESVLSAFGPFGLGSLPPIPEHAESINPSQAASASLRDLGLNTNNPAISDPNLLVYPDLCNRVERYFETRKPTPEGWTWSINNTPTPRSYTPTQSTTSAALTDSSTIGSGSVTELSQTGTSRPPTPQTALSPTRHIPQGLPQLDLVTVEPGKPLNVIAVISRMRETQTGGVQPFGPSRFLNHPSGNSTGNPNGNYLGTMSAASNQMTSLPDHMNTCIWVEGAPADLTYFEMLRSIRHCGKVYSVHINPPREKHFTAAAKIAFCTRLGAEHFFQQAHSALGIVIRGRRICVRWNRNKYRENFNRAESRVLRISGNPAFVNFQVLGEYFARLFYFNLIWVEELSPGDMIWEFSSILAQAHSAKQAIEREPAMMNIVRIQYQRDPCE
ncbi:hypothetical protein V493_02201 [Pseudogymnoascus sp. VKM F-4281 (FW-2241)]|nr:hypothetical protein V493_02201 [Pseudogymnoascus sp. VKM F-4281 (FW-2241)]